MYQLSRDYNALFDLLLNGQRVACFVDNTHDEAPRTVRDVCLAKRSGPFRVQVSVRGVSYFSIYPFEADENGADERKSFIEGCTDINLEWIVPASMPALNMMGMAAMEEALARAWLKWPLPANLRGGAHAIFEGGFRAGVAWARRQSQTEPSSQAVGTTSQYPAAVEEPEDEA